MFDSTIEATKEVPAQTEEKPQKVETNLNGADRRLNAICPKMIDIIRKEDTLTRQEYKRQLVILQQEAVREVLSRFDGKDFIDDKAPNYFLKMSEYFKTLKSENNISVEDYCYFSGLRGMVSAALLFSKSGFTVDVPEVSWDAYHDIDLLVSKRGKKFSVSVKSEKGTKDDETGESFSVRVIEKPADLPERYHKEISGHIWINIPNQYSEDAMAICEKSESARAIGLPTDFMADYFRNQLQSLRIPE